MLSLAALDLDSWRWLSPLFLPRGKGALILILGGLSVVAFSLLWSLSLRFDRLEGDHESMVQEPELSFRPAPAEVLVDAARRLDVGPARLLEAEGDRCVLQLTACRTCRRSGSKSRLCRRERKRLQRAARLLGRRPRVFETSCNPQGNGACTFEVRWRRSV